MAVRANQGSSHSAYCGDQILFASRNVASSGNASVHRGNPGSFLSLMRQIHSVAASGIANDRRLTMRVLAIQ